ncbi:hypothetical protein ACFLWA_12070 [Chloroflexota bacterium]
MAQTDITIEEFREELHKKEQGVRILLTQLNDLSDVFRVTSVELFTEGTGFHAPLDRVRINVRANL